MKAGQDSTDWTSAVNEVSRRNIDNAVGLCQGLSAPTITATVRWFDARGRDAGPGLLAWKLSNGGVEVSQPPKVWNSETRLAWLETHMPEEIEKDDGFYAETALIGAVQAKREITVPTVREFMRDAVASDSANNPKKPKPPAEPQSIHLHGTKKPLHSLGDVVEREVA